jgi:hypothetical protein
METARSTSPSYDLQTNDANQGYGKETATSKELLARWLNKFLSATAVMMPTLPRALSQTSGT